MYQKTQRMTWQIAVRFQETDQQGYRLFYPYVQESEEKLMPLDQYVREYCREDSKESRKMGRKMLDENV